MDRFAVFVDAGHLLAEGGKLCLGVRRRSLFDADYANITLALIDHCSQHCGYELLRVYWYDGAHRGIPGLDHLRIASLPNVKLRLGRMSGGRQKGVDSLIVRDLMTLARERAMVTAYVLAGDEDLREGVRDAQDFGVRVVLLGVESVETRNQAETLVQEADEHFVFHKSFIAPLLTAKAPPAGQELVVVSDAELITKARAIGAQFITEWLAKATGDEVADLLAHMPSVPRLLDSELLAAARKQLPTLEKPWLSREVRDGFRDALAASRPAEATQGGLDA